MNNLPNLILSIWELRRVSNTSLLAYECASKGNITLNKNTFYYKIISIWSMGNVVIYNLSLSYYKKMVASTKTSILQDY
jgi:hypothetical protein